MALATATITYDLANLVGLPHYKGTSVTATTNIPGDTVVDTDGNKIRLGSGRGTIDANGKGSVVVWVPGVGSNPASWQTYLHVRYRDPRAQGGATERTFGPFTITANADLADLVAEQDVPPNYTTGVLAEMTALRDETAQISGLTGEDAAVAALVNSSSSDTKAALSATIAAEVPQVGARSFATNGGLYEPSSLAALKWRQIRTRVLAGDRQGHIAWLGDSIPFGAASTGASNPKPEKCYPGRVRSILAERHGDGGGGFTLANNSVLTNVAWDPRWTFSGTVTNHTFGPFQSSSYRVDGAGTSYVEFTDECEEFWIYTLNGGGTFEVSIDGGAAVTVSNVAAGTGGTKAREAGYFVSASISHNVYKFTAGALGSHTIRLTPTNTSWDVFLVAIEGRIPTPGTFRVGNMSISGKSLYGFLNPNDETTGLYGLPWIDTMRADLLVLALGINDWQGQRPIADHKARLAQVIDRQRSTGSTMGGQHAGGDVLLLWNPKPDTATLGGGAYTNPSWDQYREAMYEVADAEDVCLFDAGDRWGGSYATANALGLYADTIHPNDNGADDLAAGIVRALFETI